jgi:hypothetical protein
MIGNLKFVGQHFKEKDSACKQGEGGSLKLIREKTKMEKM